MTKLKNSLELKKHVSAIHSSSKLSLIQRKIANALLYNAYDSLLEKDEHTIHIKYLCEIIGYDSKDYKTIRTALIALISTVIEWNLVDKDRLDSEGVWNASAIIADASISGPWCTYSYSKKMRELLHHPQLYGRLNMKVQAKFKSTYGLALYENCIRYQNLSQTQWFDIEVFRKLMGIEEGLYTIFRDFKRRVLDKAISEVNTYSPLYVTAKYKKLNRKVIALQFTLENNEKYRAEIETISIPQAEKDSLIERLTNQFGFTYAEALDIKSHYDLNYIEEKLSLIEISSSFQQGKILNISKYVKRALKDNYQSSKNIANNIEPIQQLSQIDINSRKQKEEKIEGYRRYQDKQILILYSSFSIKEKSTITKEFENYIRNNIYYGLFLKDGLQNILVADKFCDYIRIHKKDWLKSIISFEEYCSLQHATLVS